VGLRRMNIALLKAKAAEDKIATDLLTHAIEAVRNAAEGAYRPFTQQPIVRALLIPSEGTEAWRSSNTCYWRDRVIRENSAATTRPPRADRASLCGDSRRAPSSGPLDLVRKADDESTQFPYEDRRAIARSRKIRTPTNLLAFCCFVVILLLPSPTPTRNIMPKLESRLTDTIAKMRTPTGTTNYSIYWCGGTPGFGVRVTLKGARAWVLERRLNGRTVRRTLGRVPGSGRQRSFV